MIIEFKDLHYTNSEHISEELKKSHKWWTDDFNPDEDLCISEEYALTDWIKL